MVDDTTKPTRSYSAGNDNRGREIDEDPLVELARIVSEDGSFFQKIPENPVNSSESQSPQEPFSADLEAELMEQFEASFVREASGARDRADAEEPAFAVENEGGHTAYAASDSQALSAMAAEAGTQSEEVAPAEYQNLEVYEAAAAEDQTAKFDPPGQDENYRPSDPPFDPPSDPPFDPLAGHVQMPAMEPAAEPVDDPYSPAPDAAMTDTATGQSTPESFEPNAFGPNAFEPKEFEPKEFETEFADALADPPMPALQEDFTPEYGVEAYAPDAGFQDNLASGDGLDADDRDYRATQDGGNAAAGAGDDPGEVGAAMAPPAAERTGGRKGMIAVAGVLAVVVLGGGVAAYISKSAPKDPAIPAPVIKAESGSVKVMADTTESDGTAPSLLDQLTGQQAKLEEKLIDRIEEPQQFARVVLPDSDNSNVTQVMKSTGEPVEQSSGSLTDVIAKTIDRVIQEPEQPTATPRYDPIGPRKVRTVVVKSDGTIISNEDAMASTQTTLPALPSLPILEEIKVASVDSTQAPEPTPVKTMEILSFPAPDETATIAGSGAATDGEISQPPPMQVVKAEPSEPIMNAEGNAENAMQAMAAPSGAVPRSKPEDVPAAVAAAPLQLATRSARRSTSGPVNLLAAPANTDRPRVTASTAPTTNGYLVQISSRRSVAQAQASFADMKRRYNSILGEFEPDIQRADLGDKGTYYRVRIGPMASREAALRLCQQLKDAGGNCFVTR